MLQIKRLSWVTKEDNEQNITEALLVLDQMQIEEKTSLEDVKGTELKHDIGEEGDVLNGTSIDDVKLS